MAHGHVANTGTSPANPTWVRWRRPSAGAHLVVISTRGGHGTPYPSASGHSIKRTVSTARSAPTHGEASHKSAAAPPLFEHHCETTIFICFIIEVRVIWLCTALYGSLNEEHAMTIQHFSQRIRTLNITRDNKSIFHYHFKMFTYATNSESKPRRHIISRGKSKYYIQWFSLRKTKAELSHPSHHVSFHRQQCFAEIIQISFIRWPKSWNLCELATTDSAFYPAVAMLSMAKMRRRDYYLGKNIRLNCKLMIFPFVKIVLYWSTKVI